MRRRGAGSLRVLLTGAPAPAVGVTLTSTWLSRCCGRRRLRRRCRTSLSAPCTRSRNRSLRRSARSRKRGTMILNNSGSRLTNNTNNTSKSNKNRGNPSSSRSSSSSSNSGSPSRNSSSGSLSSRSSGSRSRSRTSSGSNSGSPREAPSPRPTPRAAFRRTLDCRSPPSPPRPPPPAEFSRPVVCAAFFVLPTHTSTPTVADQFEPPTTTPRHRRDTASSTAREWGGQRERVSRSRSRSRSPAGVRGSPRLGSHTNRTYVTTSALC